MLQYGPSMRDARPGCNTTLLLSDLDLYVCILDIIKVLIYFMS